MLVPNGWLVVVEPNGRLVVFAVPNGLGLVPVLPNGLACVVPLPNAEVALPLLPVLLPKADVVVPPNGFFAAVVDVDANGELVLLPNPPELPNPD